MTLLQTIWIALLIVTCLANAVAYWCAVLAIEHAKERGVVPKSTPSLFTWLDIFGAHFIEHVYTDFHKRFDCPTVTRSIRVVRYATPIGLFLILGQCALSITGVFG